MIPSSLIDQKEDPLQTSSTGWSIFFFFLAHGGGHTNQASVYPDLPTNPSVHLSPANLTLSLLRLVSSGPPTNLSNPAAAFLPSSFPFRSRRGSPDNCCASRAAAAPPDGNSLRSGLKRGRADGRRGRTDAAERAGGARATDARAATASRRYKFVTGAIFQIRSITFIMRRGESIRGNGDEKYRAETLADSQTVAAPRRPMRLKAIRERRWRRDPRTRKSTRARACVCAATVSPPLSAQRATERAKGADRVIHHTWPDRASEEWG